MKNEDERTGRKAIRGPMAVVYFIIVIGILAIATYAFFSGIGPQDETTPETRVGSVIVGPFSRAA